MGSGNVGARNVGRVLGIPGFLATLLVDFFKGTFAVWTTCSGISTEDNRLAGVAMLAVVVGHIWPIQLGFRGGKGVATLLGAICVYDFHLALAFAAMFTGLFVVFRRTTLSGLIAVACLPLAAMFQDPEPLRSGIISILAGMIWIAHRKNLLEEFALIFGTSARFNPNQTRPQNKVMELRSQLVFKIATEDWEIDLVHQLNYKTFVEEIPQHAASSSKRLVDKFHAENTYLICLSGRQLVGMLAARGQRPFSLDQKVVNLDSYLPAGRSLGGEVRLLSVDKKFRTGQVFQGLMTLMWQHFVEKGYDMGVISGTTRGESKLYHHLGFIPFGPLVGQGRDAISADVFKHRIL